MRKIKILFPDFITSILNSYSQIFFSNNWKFSILLMVVTFFDPVAGLSGLLSVIFSNCAAYLIGFNRFNIRSGYYGFNSLLVGLGLGIYFQLNFEFLLVLLFASALTLFITVMMEGVIGKYGLPFLSVPFLIGIWLLTLATRQFTSLHISERSIYMLNEMYKIGGLKAVKVFLWFGDITIPESLIIYFRSIGAIFFQNYLLAGVLIAIGLLLYSRIAFTLSLISFYSAFIFYTFIGANINDLSYYYIGYNFILTSIAIGGFFIIPSRYSYLWVVLLTPLIAVIIIASNAILSVYQLQIFSLPFNFIVILFLYILKFRERFFTKPELVYSQHYSPEKNLYTQFNNKERFNNTNYFPFSLPFWGEWTVTQGHNGDITHKKEWKHAWDFEVFDEDGLAFKKTGVKREDYYCYNKPITAPYFGVVEEIFDDVEDNEIGLVNTEQNWGNTIIIKHAEGLYSKLCHLKKGTFKVAKGDYVKKGDILAHCGNSGRSPKPHVHFQLQATPFIGSKTIEYPLAHYILKEQKTFKLMSFSKPEQNDKISQIEKNSSLVKAFKFIPGQTMFYKVTDGAGNFVKTLEWEICVDIYNNTYIWCKQSKSSIYFKTGEEMIYFTSFTGNKKSYLFYFYLACYKVLFGYYKDLEIKDVYPVSDLNNKYLLVIQDFIAPFFMFMKSGYNLNYVSKSDDLSYSTIKLKSSTEIKVFGKATRSIDSEILISRDKIENIKVNDRNHIINLQNIEKTDD